MTAQKILPKLATFATLCDSSEKAIDVALASNSRDQNLALFGEGSRDLGAHLVRQSGIIATLARVLSFVVDVDDAGKVDADQREQARVVFQRELSIGWLMKTHGLTEDKARSELADMTERAKKARGNAQTYWARALTHAELRDPETEEQAAKREQAAAKKNATKEAKRAAEAQAKADKAAQAANDATSAASQAVAPTAEKPVSDAPKALDVKPEPQAVLTALMLMEPDAMLATLTQAAHKRREAGTIGKAGDHALAQFVLVGAAWRKDRDAEIESIKAMPVNAELQAALAEIAKLREQVAAEAKAAHGPVANPAAVKALGDAVADAEVQAARKPRTTRGK